MGIIKDSLTFDDVTLIPSFSSILPSEAITTTDLGQKLRLKIPLMSSAMDTVTEAKMAIALSKAGGLGVIHRNLTIEKQISEIRKVKAKKCLIGAAVGASPREHLRAQKILRENGVVMYPRL